MRHLTKLRLKCGKCGHIGKYSAAPIYVDPQKSDKADDVSERVYYGGYFRCAKCGSGWPWEVTPDALAAITLLMMQKVGDPEGVVALEFARPQLFDGSIGYSAAYAEDYLKAVLDKDPENSFIWDRLGNIYHRCGLEAEAEQAFRKALEINPTELRSHFSLGDMLFDRARYEESAGHLHQVLQLAREDREVPQNEKRDLVRAAIESLLDINTKTEGRIDVLPATDAVKSKSIKEVVPMSFDLSHERDWNRLIDLFLGKSAELERRPARNAPCPCGSGKKYKQCCLARES